MPADLEQTPDPATHSTLRTSGKNLEIGPVRQATKLIRGGVHREEWTTDPLNRSVVNPPVYHASTVIFPTVASLKYANRDWPHSGLFYGRHGNPTTYALEEAFCALEGADNACVAASGVAATNAAILSIVHSGDHILVTDAVYEPARNFCNRFLKRYGVDTSYFSPTATPDQFATLIRSNTKLVLVETPSSLSFEVTDIPAIAAKAHEKGLKVIMDNSWGPSLFSPFEHGCDISVCSATKYIGGHSDLLMGIVGARDAKTYRAIKRTIVDLGCPPGSNEAYMALRGIRTLGVRLKQHEKNGMTVALWLEGREEVLRVMHPGLESHPQHDIFKRLFKGSTGLFGFQLREGFSQGAVDAMLDGMKLIAMGYSWGGFESLLMHYDINSSRSVDTWKYGDGYGQTMRIHVGLEDVDDVIADLKSGFERLSSYNATTNRTDITSHCCQQGTPLP